MSKQLIQGVLYVMAGASSCAVVGVLVKLAGKDGYAPAEIIFTQALLGAIIIVLFYYLQLQKSEKTQELCVAKKDRYKLLLGGIPLALTNTFYYISIQHVDVSVSTIMLMQSVWIGVVLDYFINKVKPGWIKIVAILVVLVGTVLATNVLNSNGQLNVRGIFFGFLAGLSYSFTYVVTNNIGKRYKPIARSVYIILGSFILVSFIWGAKAIHQFNPEILYTWGLIIALFSTVLPPLLLTKGMPLIDVGLGSIIGSMELPVTAIAAYLLLGESMSSIQIAGVLLILVAIIVMNIYSTPKSKSNI